MNNRLYLLVLLLVLPCLLPLRVTGADAPPGRADFDSARQAFHGGDYATALRRFRAAHAAGMDTAALHYNLGVTCYRLGRYDEAEREFSALLADPASASVARYNLGLVAMRRGQNATARGQFAAARDAAMTPELRALAGSALDRLEEVDAATRAQGLVSLGAGHDDNVALTPETDLIGVSERGDAFVELLATLRLPFAGTAADGFRFEAGGYGRAYQDMAGFDQQSGRIGLTRLFPLDGWAGLAGVTLDTSYLNGDRFQTATTLNVQAGHLLSQARQLLLRYRASRINGGDAYRQISGWRHRAGAEATLPWQNNRLLLGYELEYNDRKDLASGAEFFSQSPLRNGVYAELRLPAGTRWEVSARADYRRSDYADPDVRVTGSGTRRDTRADNLWQASVRAGYRLDRRWQLYARYSHTVNDSVFDEFSYRRNEALAGVEVLF